MLDITDLPYDITQHVVYFRDFLNTCWPSLKILLEQHNWTMDPNFLEDWIARNWEFLVGRELLGEHIYSLPLNFDRLKRFPDSRAYSKVLCEIAPGVGIQKSEEEEVVVYSFHSPVKGISRLCPPFDFVEARTYDTKKAYIVPIQSCRFILAEIWDLSSGLR